tara:strand:+ start:385 stop:1086 length:702 start_codon:yes stop_codon:yes gene_type:complete
MKYSLFSINTFAQDPLNVSITLGVHFGLALFPAIAIFRTEGKSKGLSTLYALCLVSLFVAYFTSPFSVTIMAVALSCMIWLPIIVITTVFRGVDCNETQQQKECAPKYTPKYASSNNSNEAFFKHQSIKLEFLRYFKKGSSSELSFLRRVAGLSILDALCALTDREADSLFIDAEGIDFTSLIKENKDHPLVEVFMLSYGIDSDEDESSGRDEEFIIHAISQLTKILPIEKQP